MIFEWDDGKRQANLARHDLDMVRAARIFDGPTITNKDGPMTTAKRAIKASVTSATTVSSSSGPKGMASPGSSVLAEVGVAIGNGMYSATLDEIIAADERGELYHNPNAPEGPDLPDSFWENAVLEGPRRTRPVHLKLDAEVFEHFVAETGGKGHITRMQEVLKSYVRAKQAAAAKKLPKG